MQSVTTIIAASALVASVSGAPLVARDICGTAPSTTSNAARTPISQPTGCTTAAQCQVKCEANASCLAFLFGLVDGVDECMLFDVPAAQLPPQSSPNLVAYDKACSSVPAVVPTTANPQGLNIASTPATGSNTPATGNTGSNTPATGNTGASTPATGNTGASPAGGKRQTHDAPLNAAPAGNPTPLAQPKVDDLAACLAACKGNPACIQYTFENGICKLFGPVAKRQTPAPTHDAPLNVAPAGNPTPLAQPKVDDLAACLAACKGNPACIQYTFENGICKLFGPLAKRDTPAPAANNGAATNGAATNGAANNNGAAPATNSPANGGAQTATPTHEAPLNMIPAGNPAPIATPAVDSLAACLAACKGNLLCIAYTFESGICKLFS